MAAFWWVGAAIVACSLLPGAWQSDWMFGDYLTSVLMTHVNEEFFGLPAVYGNPAGLGMSYHPGPFYVGLTYLVELVASAGFGSYTPLTLSFLLLSTLMYGASVWLTWRSLGMWPAAVLMWLIAAVVAFFPGALGSVFLPGNENLQGPAALLGLASAAAVAKGRPAGYLFGALAFVPLAHAHWGSLPLALVLLTYFVLTAVRRRPPLRTLVAPAAVSVAALAHWVLIGVRYPDFYAGAVRWLGSTGSQLDTGLATPGVRDNLGLFFSFSVKGVAECSSPECLAAGGAALVALVSVALLGAVLFARERLWFLAVLTVSALPYSIALLSQDPDTNSGPRLFYTSMAVWLFAAAYAAARLFKYVPKAAPFALGVAVAVFPLTFAPFVDEYARYGATPLIPSLDVDTPGGSVLMTGDGELQYAALALSVSEGRRGRKACLWTPTVFFERVNGEPFVLSPTSRGSLLASPCPASGELLLVNPEVPPGGTPILDIPWGDSSLRVYRAGTVECTQLFPCADLTRELAQYYPSRWEQLQPAQ